MAKINLNNVLITGGDGMVGSYADFGIRTNRRLLDVTDLKEVLSVGRKLNPSAILHLAAETDVDRCERDPEYAYTVNTIGTYHMATLARELNVKMVYVSTAGVFDGQKKTSYTEDDIPNPKNFYGRSKYAGELIVRGMLSDYIIARACWMFGGGPAKDQKFVAKIIRQFDAKEIKVVDDQFGSPTFGKDLMAEIKKLVLHDERGIFHCANAGVCSRYDFAKEIAKILNQKIVITPTKIASFSLDAFRAPNEGLASRINFMRPWREGLREYLETEWNAATYA